MLNHDKTIKATLTKTLRYERPNGTCLVFEAGTEVAIELRPPGMATDLSLNSRWEGQERIVFTHGGRTFRIYPDAYKMVK